MTDRPDIALLNDKQLASIRADLRDMQAKQKWADITNGDIERLHYLALTIDPESRPGRGHDCRWMWSNGEVIIGGNVDVYGNGEEPLYCVPEPDDWWRTADNEEYEP
ncbi:hypothetical protein [Corynebacterium sp. AOP12-C2-36]|uniref:hypothetical protein n=1 Tax=Corynebacterium sp. AOP12-C2-36 TaxID=3457723 RepID=UPI004034DFDC